MIMIMMKKMTSMPGKLLSVSGDDPVILEPKLAASFSKSKPCLKHYHVLSKPW